jgi:putative Mg2+ transporter-C (MgtC) family protein
MHLNIFSIFKRNNPYTKMTISVFSVRLLSALAAGFLIGFERQWHHKAAGLRTNTLVAIGSALYVLLSIQLTLENGDVTRIIGQVVTGIGFLGAGIIFKEGTNVYGLTTAATVWCSSAIGCLAAAGYFVETLIGTFAIIFINSILVPLDIWMSKRTKNGEGTTK